MTDADDGQADRLDGNVAAGLLAELFRREPSTAQTICSGCGATGPVGSLLVYGLEMGAILRCPACDTAIMRVGVAGTLFYLDLRGAVSVRFESSG
jgi:hypothetical protein